MNNKEIWKNVKGYEKLYQVSNLGRLRSLDRVTNHSKGGLRVVKGKILKGSLSLGYPSFGFKKNGKIKRMRIHQVVAIAFLGHTPCKYDKVVNHIDNNPLNNNVSNLEIVTVSYNNRCHKNTSSKYPYISFVKSISKWRVRVLNENGKRVLLGTFKTEQEAYTAFNENKKRHPEECLS